VSLVVLSFFRDAAAAAALADLVAAHGGILGAAVCCAEKGGDPSDEWTTCEQDRDELLDRIFTLAKERDLDLDFHTDENGNELARGLRYVAQKAVQHGYQGRVVCGHCWCVGPCVGWGRGKGDWGAGGKWWLLCERLCVEGRSYSDRNRSCPALSGGCIWPGLCAAPTSPPPRAAPVQPVCHQPPLPPHPAAPSPSSPPTSWPRRWRLRGRRASPLCRCRWSTSGRRTAPTPAAARPAGAASRCCTSCERPASPPPSPPTTCATSSTPTETWTCWKCSLRRGGWVGSGAEEWSTWEGGGPSG
jgi:hypothetical protein